jgi:hypothetical protein
MYIRGYVSCFGTHTSRIHILYSLLTTHPHPLTHTHTHSGGLTSSKSSGLVPLSPQDANSPCIFPLCTFPPRSLKTDKPLPASHEARFLPEVQMGSRGGEDAGHNKKHAMSKYTLNSIHRDMNEWCLLAMGYRSQAGILDIVSAERFRHFNEKPGWNFGDQRCHVIHYIWIPRSMSQLSEHARLRLDVRDFCCDRRTDCKSKGTQIPNPALISRKGKSVSS